MAVWSGLAADGDPKVAFKNHYYSLMSMESVGDPYIRAIWGNLLKSHHDFFQMVRSVTPGTIFFLVTADRSR